MKIMLYKANKGTWLDKIIDAFSGGYGYSHVELAFDKIYDDPKNGYICFSSSPREGKVRFKYINPHVNDHWEIIDLNHTLEEEQRIYSGSFEYLNAKYDYYGIMFWYVFFWVKKQHDDKWWCSEIVSYLLGFDKYRKTPNELAKIFGANKR